MKLETSSPVCIHCGEKMATFDCSEELLCWRIPFTSIEIKLCRWGCQYYCSQCMADQDRINAERGYEEVYDIGFEKGYDAGTGGNQW